MHLTTLDYTVLTAYLLLIAFIGTAFGWLVKDVAAFLKGGNTIPWYIAGTSNFMSMFSTFVFVAYAGIAYEHGLVAISVFWCTVPPCIIAGLFLAKRWRRAELTTPVEYLERRFNVATRQVYSWMGLLMRFLDNAVRLYATGLFLSTVTPISLLEAVIVSGTLITIFTMIGGLWAVTVLDTIQFIVLFIATAILLPLTLAEAGWFGGIAAEFPNHLDWFNGPKGAPFWLLVYYMMVTLKYNANWAFIQRLYSVRDEKAGRKVAFCSAILFFIAPVIFLLPAVAARVIVPELEDPERAYIAVCAVMLPSGMMGLMLASMFSATMSALNSEFNVMAGVLTNDIYKRLIRPGSDDKHLMWVARFATVLSGGVITIGATFVGAFGGAFEANKLFTGIFAIPLAIPLILALLWRRPSPAGAIVTIFGGAAFALTLNLGAWLSWEATTLLVMGVCLALLAFVRKPGGRGPRQREKEEQFFQQLNTPLTPDKIPTIEPGLATALKGLFALSFFVSGALFAITGFLAMGTFAGQMALVLGLIALSAGIWLWVARKKSVKKEEPARTSD